MILTCLILALSTTSSFAQSLSGKNAQELKKMQTEAVANENYDLAEKIKKQLDRIEANKAKIAKLEEEKKDAILIEDYSKAEALENEIEALKSGNTATITKPIKKPSETVVAPTPTPTPISVIPTTPQPIESSYGSRDFFKNGLYMDGYAGLASGGGETGIGLAYGLGNKWYFGSSESHQMGFQARWIRVGIYVMGDEPLIHLAPVNVGFINLFKFSESSGMETNLNIGYSLFLNADDEALGGGFTFNPEIKYRFKKLSIGMDYLLSSYSYEEQIQTSTYIEYDPFFGTGGYYDYDYQYRTVSTSVGIFSLSLGLKF